ncbi:MAG: hypothetical protein L0Z53_25360 [Acidobacteriales bacterium]|nr:hypothetical protein [Terriglobales bacterium]
MVATFERGVQISLLALEIYVLLGVLFALLFVTRGVQSIDTQAHNAPIGFRLIIFPGVVAFWPLLFRRWLQGLSDPPVERNPHT